MSAERTLNGIPYTAVRASYDGPNAEETFKGKLLIFGDDGIYVRDRNAPPGSPWTKVPDWSTK